MKLYKALKERKNLIGDITKLKHQIKDKNSYLEGSKNGEKFNVAEAYDILMGKIEELTSLKFVINEANREIQGQIYLLGEYKALISFLNELNVTEGANTNGYNDNVLNYVVQIDEERRNELVKKFQTIVDAIQEELDEYNFNTEIPWGDMTEEELELHESEFEARMKEDQEECCEKEACGCKKGCCEGHTDTEVKE